MKYDTQAIVKQLKVGSWIEANVYESYECQCDDLDCSGECCFDPDEEQLELFQVTNVNRRDREVVCNHVVLPFTCIKSVRNR